MSDTAQRAKAIEIFGMVYDYVDFNGQISPGDKELALAEIEAALAASPVAVWTEERPVKEGFYWYREPTEPGFGTDMHYVMNVNGQLKIVTLCSDAEPSRLVTDPYYVGEWCPIPPPQEGHNGL